MLDPEGHPYVAAILDVAMAGMEGTRARLIPQARGRVLEIGMGTGANLPHYGAVDEVVGLEPDPHMRKRAARRASELHVPVQLVDADAAHLPFPDASFDTVVATWVLCTIPHAEQACVEMRRVLKPDGLLIFAEHTLSRHAPQQHLQHLLTPVWKRFAGGCHLDRDSLAMLRQAGFVLEVDPNPRDTWTLVPVYRGTAHI